MKIFVAQSEYDKLMSQRDALYDKLDQILVLVSSKPKGWQDAIRRIVLEALERTE